MNTLLGIALQVAALFVFTLMSAMVRYLGDRVPIGEVVFARSFVALLPLFVILAWRGQLVTAVRTHNPRGHIMRSLTGIAAMFANFAGLARLPLADATAIGFASPIFNVILAALMLGEVVRAWRWSAVAVGLIGVLVMLSPHLGHAPPGADTALGAVFSLSGAFLISVAMTQVRHLAATETTASLVFYFSVISALGGLVTLPWGWVMPAAGDLAALLATGVLGGMGQILITESYRHAPASVVAPFSYSSMLWSVAIGYVWFGEVPELAVLFGAVLVILAGWFVIWRERRLGLARAVRSGSPGPGGPAL